MGTDNLFHKKKERKAESLRRMRATKDPYDVILIVCEGEKTEPNYFNGLRKAFRLNNANIKVCGRGSDPLSIVDFAIDTCKKESKFDRAYCVFDRDRHPTYDTALNKIKQIKHTRSCKGYEIIAVSSNPCFEFWLLLHFKYTTMQFNAPANSSICDTVIKELKKDFPEYQKGDKDIFKKIQDKVDTAIKNAHKIEKSNQTSGADSPSTSVHLLVEYLQNFKK